MPLIASFIRTWWVLPAHGGRIRSRPCLHRPAGLFSEEVGNQVPPGFPNPRHSLPVKRGRLPRFIVKGPSCDMPSSITHGPQAPSSVERTSHRRSLLPIHRVRPPLRIWNAGEKAQTRFVEPPPPPFFASFLLIIALWVLNKIMCHCFPNISMRPGDVRARGKRGLQEEAGRRAERLLGSRTGKAVPRPRPWDDTRLRQLGFVGSGGRCKGPGEGFQHAERVLRRRTLWGGNELL